MLNSFAKMVEDCEKGKNHPRKVMQIIRTEIGTKHCLRCISVLWVGEKVEKVFSPCLEYVPIAS